MTHTGGFPEVTSVRLCIENALAQIDAALDQNDRRQFRVWSKRYLSLCGRLSTLLLKIAQAPEA